MKLYILFLFFVTFSCAVCRNLREDTVFWSSIYVESSSEEGPFLISGIDPDGKYIQIDNTFDERKYLNGWTLRQIFGDNKVLNYTFSFCSIPPNSRRKIFSNNSAQNASLLKDFVATDIPVWATGNDVKTYLFDVNGTRQAEHIVSMASSKNLGYF